MKRTSIIRFFVTLAAVAASASQGAVVFVDLIPNQNLGGIFPRSYDVDFDQDGTPEVRMDVSTVSTDGFDAEPFLHAKVQSIPGDPGSHYGWPVFNGQIIGPAAISPASWVYNSRGSTLGVVQDIGFFGYWAEDAIAHVAVEFLLADGLHYGGVEVQGFFGNGRILSYGWETTPGVPIIAGSPEPTRALLLMLAAAACLLRRRRAW